LPLFSKARLYKGQTKKGWMIDLTPTSEVHRTAV